MKNPIEHAMILAAGLGKRMRPLTDDRPKPLIEVAGTSLLDRNLDHLNSAGVSSIVVNLHYRGHMIRQHLDQRAQSNPDEAAVLLSDESDQLLETGGGVTKALPLLGGGAFFVMNGDMLWREVASETAVPETILDRMAACWDDKTMDALLMMVPLGRTLGYDGNGDYHMDNTGQADSGIATAARLTRRAPDSAAPFLFGGVQILHSRLFTGCKAEPFSLNLLYDRAQEVGRLLGLALDGEWMHVGTPQALSDAEQRLKQPLSLQSMS